MLLLLSLPACAADGAEVPIVVEMYDLAHLPEPVLTDVISEVQRVYAGASLPVLIEPQAPDADVAKGLGDPVRSAREARPPQCASTFDVRVQITDRLSPRYKEGSAGFSLPFSPGGIRVTLFYDRIRNIARNTAVSLPKVLAAVLAHELGHVLLGNDSHSGDGIMRDYWERRDFSELSADFPALSEYEIANIRTRLKLWRRVTPTCAAPGKRPVS